VATTVIPLGQVPSQQLAITLANQPCVVSLRQIGGRQYFSLAINGTVICENVLIVDGSPIVQAPYTGLVGDFASVDQQGNAAPDYTGWGTRWLLVFNDAASI